MQIARELIGPKQCKYTVTCNGVTVCNSNIQYNNTNLCNVQTCTGNNCQELGELYTSDNISCVDSGDGGDSSQSGGGQESDAQGGQYEQ